MSDHSEVLRRVLVWDWPHDAEVRKTTDALILAADVLDAIPGDDKRLVAEWVVKIATQHLISTDRTRYVTAERLNALDALMDATDACPPSVRAALRGGA